MVPAGTDRTTAVTDRQHVQTEACGEGRRVPSERSGHRRRESETGESDKIRMIKINAKATSQDIHLGEPTGRSNENNL